MKRFSELPAFATPLGEIAPPGDPPHSRSGVAGRPRHITRLARDGWHMLRVAIALPTLLFGPLILFNTEISDALSMWMMRDYAPHTALNGTPRTADDPGLRLTLDAGQGWPAAELRPVNHLVQATREAQAANKIARLAGDYE